MRSGNWCAVGVLALMFGCDSGSSNDGDPVGGMSSSSALEELPSGSMMISPDGVGPSVAPSSDGAGGNGPTDPGSGGALAGGAGGQSPGSGDAGSAGTMASSGGRGGESSQNTGGDAGAPGGSAGEASLGGGGSAGAVGGGAGGVPSTGGNGGEGPVIVQAPVVYVGGFDYGSDTYPLTIYDLDKESGALTQRSETAEAGPNPSYIAVAPSGRILYVANERDDSLGGLTALSVAADGGLTPLNHQGGSDGGFTYVAVDPSGQYVFGASYNGGSVSVFPVEADGSLGPELDSVDFGGGAQSHAVAFDASGGFVLVPNKGANHIAQLVLNTDGTLSPNTPPQVDAEPGAGPRHIAVHPDGDLAFVINELNSTMVPYQLAADGTLTAGTAVSTLPAGAPQNTGAHVEMSPDGRFVYGSNRGHNSIVVFSVDQTTGALTLIEHEPTGGNTPRDFDMDPEGDVLIVANQDSGTLQVLGIADDGMLTPLGAPVNGPPSPAAVQIVYLPE